MPGCRDESATLPPPDVRESPATVTLSHKRVSSNSLSVEFTFVSSAIEKSVRFGDRTEITTPQNNIVHTYPAAGIYVVTVIVRNTSGSVEASACIDLDRELDCP
jgi:PKD repeat protein